MMVMRVLPFAWACRRARCGTSFARLALEKSYSLRITQSLIVSGLACGDEANTVRVTQCIDDSQQADAGAHASQHPACLAGRSVVFLGQRHRIQQGCRGLFKADAMLAEVCVSLRVIPLDLYMHR